MWYKWYLLASIYQKTLRIHKLWSLQYPENWENIISYSSCKVLVTRKDSLDVTIYIENHRRILTRTKVLGAITVAPDYSCQGDPRNNCCCNMFSTGGITLMNFGSQRLRRGKLWLLIMKTLRWKVLWGFWLRNDQQRFWFPLACGNLNTDFSSLALSCTVESKLGLDVKGLPDSDTNCSCNL